MPPRSSASNQFERPAVAVPDGACKDSGAGSPSTAGSGRLRLALACGVIAVVWLVVLPWLGSQPAIERAVRRQQARGISAGALFYTDLEVMGSVLRRMERLQRRHPDALWLPGRRDRGVGKHGPAHAGRPD